MPLKPMNLNDSSVPSEDTLVEKFIASERWRPLLADVSKTGLCLFAEQVLYALAHVKYPDLCNDDSWRDAVLRDTELLDSVLSKDLQNSREWRQVVAGEYAETEMRNFLDFCNGRVGFPMIGGHIGMEGLVLRFLHAVVPYFDTLTMCNYMVRSLEFYENVATTEEQGHYPFVPHDLHLYYHKTAVMCKRGDKALHRFQYLDQIVRNDAWEWAQEHGLDTPC